MLSYMLPVEEKPPLPKGLQLELAALRGVKASATDSSVSTTSSSDLATPPKSTKTKLAVNGTKHPTLKRVSFGSSKGSMVETLIYESPVQEEPEASPILEDVCPFPADAESESEPSKRVRVTFFECERPLVVSSPSPEPAVDAAPSPVMTSPAVDHAPTYTRQASTDSGWDNPFRPDGDLSREADEIVELIKGGKPITPTPGSVAPPLPSVDSHDAPTVATAASAVQQQSPPAAAVTATKQQQQQQQQQQANNKAAGANGNALESKAAPATTGPVEVQRGTVVQPSDASQVEHVVLKKKPKCKCCVIQ